MATPLPKPTDAELAILRVLWRRGPSTVREVAAELRDDRRSSGYTTILKFMQIMHAKGLLARDESQRTHVYRPRVGEQNVQRRLLGDLAQRAFGGSAHRLILQALSSRRASRKELEEIAELIDKLKGG